MNYTRAYNLNRCVVIVSRPSATPRLYQEICERGLQSTNHDELIDDFVVVEPQVEDQGIVVKSYRPPQLIWSHLPQVGPLCPPTHLWVRQGWESVVAGGWTAGPKVLAWIPCANVTRVYMIPPTPPPTPEGSHKYI